MNNIDEIIRQDFNAVKLAFTESDFSGMNVYANRLMGNVIFGTQRQYGLIGFFLKQIAIDLLRAQPDAEKMLRPIADVFIANLDASLKDASLNSEIDLQSVWRAYFTYADSSRKIFMNPVERRVYRDNKRFTKEATMCLATELLSGTAVYEENSQVSRGVLTEIDRLIRNHGAEEAELVLVSLLVALSRLIDYIKAGASAGQESFKSMLSPWFERIQTWRDTGEKFPYRQATDLLCDIIVEWRMSFIRYTELGRPTPGQERKIELPPEAKERIGKTIAAALQEDLEKAGRAKKR